VNRPSPRDAGHIDESTVSRLPDFVKVYQQGNYVAVVCEGAGAGGRWP